MQFYYYEPLEEVYKPVSDGKLGNLMRGHFIRCAEELGNDVHKWKLFTEFRSDKTIRAIVHRAKSILACESDYFSVESKHGREQGPELYERVALAFVQQILERQPGETLLLTDAYVHFCEYLRKRNMAPVKRSIFKNLVPSVIQQQYDLRIRNDLPGEASGGIHRGWRGIGILGPEGAAQQS